MINCPQCGQEELYLVGAVVRGQTGISYTGSLSLDDLATIKPVVEDGLLLCRSCKKQSTTTAVNKFNELVKIGVLWDTNADGIKVPVICPICQNTRSFIRNTTRQVATYQEVTIVAGEVVAIIPEVLATTMEDDAITATSITLDYVCNKDNCTGRIVLHEP